MPSSDLQPCEGQEVPDQKTVRDELYSAVMPAPVWVRAAAAQIGPVASRIECAGSTSAVSKPGCQDVHRDIGCSAGRVGRGSRSLAKPARIESESGEVIGSRARHFKKSCG